jgi:hypothetical protein
MDPIRPRSLPPFTGARVAFASGWLRAKRGANDEGGADRALDPQHDASAPAENERRRKAAHSEAASKRAALVEQARSRPTREAEEACGLAPRVACRHGREGNAGPPPCDGRKRASPVEARPAGRSSDVDDERPPGSETAKHVRHSHFERGPRRSGIRRNLPRTDERCGRKHGRGEPRDDGERPGEQSGPGRSSHS